MGYPHEPFLLNCVAWFRQQHRNVGRMKSRDVHTGADVLIVSLSVEMLSNRELCTETKTIEMAASFSFPLTSLPCILLLQYLLYML